MGIKGLLVDIIHRRLGKYGLQCLLIGLVRHIFHIITNQHPKLLHGDSEVMLHLMLKFLCLYGKIRFLFYVHTTYISHWVVLLLMC